MRCGELFMREEKAEPARVMELEMELPQRFQMRARIPGHAGFGDCQDR